MNTEKEIREIEDKMIRESFEDGIVELFLGLIGLWAWVNMHFEIENRILMYLVFLVPIAFVRNYIEFFKRKFIFPRRGYNDQKKYGKRQVLQALILTVIALGLIFSIVLILEAEDSAISSFFNTYLYLILGTMAAVFLQFVAAITKIKRLKRYALLVALAFFIRFNFTFSIEVFFLYFSILPLVTGFYLFMRFLKKYPVVEMENTEIPVRKMQE